MKKILYTIPFYLLASMMMCINIKAQYVLQNAFPNFTFNNPLFLTNAGDGTNRVFVVEQAGRIKVFENSSSATTVKTFLDISDRVISGGEEGLLGLTFHPDYENNGYFYVNYTASGPLRTVVSRFKVTSNPDSADKNSEFQIITYNQPYSNHNCGWISFRPTDGYLYIGAGDGGSGGDPGNRAQNITEYLGKILRIDVDGGSPYAIPPTNPFYDSTNAQIKKEIYAWGFRNPWRDCFDPVTDWFWVADVGQNNWEEIDIVENGKNYGWRCYEGNHNYNTSGCNYPEYIFPIWEYSHSFGCSITGGYVYRGSGTPSLTGKYIYADYCSGIVWALEYDGINPATNTTLLTAPSSVTSFGVDENNELYITSFNGIIYRFETEIPVELTSFTAREQNEKIILEWTTATELNNRGFEIERSQKHENGTQSEWTNIGFVNGNGTTTEKHSYSFVDEEFPGTVYYRLKQVDLDGSYSYSDVVEVNGTNVNSFKLEQNYPNPFNPGTVISYNLPEESMVNITVYDPLGRIVDNITNEIISAGYHEKSWNASQFSSGIYYLKMNAESVSSDKKFSKVLKMMYVK